MQIFRLSQNHCQPINEIEVIYAKFLTLVSKGRGMTIEEVDEIAQGRVWNAQDALNIGLVDELGGMERAIEIAFEMAELEDYRLYELPVQKDPLDQIMEDLMGRSTTKLIRNELGDKYIYYQYLKSLEKMEGVQARLPFEIRIR
jgi:protease-4